MKKTRENQSQNEEITKKSYKKKKSLIETKVEAKGGKRGRKHNNGKASNEHNCEINFRKIKN